MDFVDTADVYTKINDHLQSCVNVSDPRKKCARHKLCTRCTNLSARQKTAELYSTIEMLKELKPWIEIGGELTRTLPGVKHPSRIRTKPLHLQYRYWSKISRWTKNGRPNKWASYLRGEGVVGMIDFLEAVQNKKNGRWHLHSHSILFQDSSNPITLQPTDVELSCKECGLDLEECEDHTHWVSGYDRHVQGGWNRDIAACGFGPRYSWDPGVEIDVGYLTKLSYNTKAAQFDEKVTPRGQRELTGFFRLERPRLIRRYGEARISKADRTFYNDIKNQ